MDPAAMQALVESFQQMAKSNQDLVQSFKDGATQPQPAPTTVSATTVPTATC